jgi:hypothetical protein
LAILVSDWLISKKSSPLKPLGQMNRNLVGSIPGRSSINNAHFVLKNRQYLYRELHFEYIYLYLNKCYLSFNRDVLEINQSEKRIACGWPCLLSDLDKMSILYRGPSPLKLLGQMNRNLVGSIPGRSSINIAHFVLIHYQTWLPQAILVSDWPI